MRIMSVTTSQKNLQRTIKGTDNTMPGPDGIRFKAWRELGETGLKVLYYVMRDLKDGNAEAILDHA